MVEPLLKTSDVARLLGVHPETVRRMVRAGILAACYLSSNLRPKLRFKPEVVRGFVDGSGSRIDPRRPHA